MAREIKAGVEFVLKVNTEADKFGVESYFSANYFSDKDKTITYIDDSFFEYIDENVDGTGSTTVVGDYSKGDTVITLDSVDDYNPNCVVKLGGNYYRTTDINTDDKKITLKDGLVTALSDGDASEVSGRTGTYGVPVTLPAVGTYTFQITNFKIGMDNVTASVIATAADVDDVKTLLDNVKSEVDSIKEQVDALDEEELNNIKEQIDALEGHLGSLHRLIEDDNDVYIEINGDETGLIHKDDVVTGSDSGATGTVQFVSYDEDNDVTKVTMIDIDDAFQTDEKVKVGDNESTGTINLIKNNTINSVIEFVKEIQELLNSDTGLAELKTVSKNIIHMINGDDKLEDDSDCPTAGKGLVAIFDELTAAHSDISAIKDLAEDSTNGFQAIKTAVDDARSSIEGKIDALVDEDDENSLVSKLNAVKNVVDANKGLLEDSDNGLAAINDAISNVHALFEDGGDVEVRFDNIESLINDLNSALDDQTAHIDSKFAELQAQIEQYTKATRFTVFA